MKKIASFTIDHQKLDPGLYVSRVDEFGETAITTFDIRLTKPNAEPVMNTAEIHTMEHLCATFARNDEKWAKDVVYFGPMGCRTGFYLLLNGNLSSRDVLDFVTRMFEFVRDYEGQIPGASPVECGNYLDMNLPMAKWRARMFLDKVLYNINDAHLFYPNQSELKKKIILINI